MDWMKKVLLPNLGSILQVLLRGYVFKLVLVAGLVGAVGFPLLMSVILFYAAIVYLFGNTLAEDAIFIARE